MAVPAICASSPDPPLPQSWPRGTFKTERFRIYLILGFSLWKLISESVFHMECFEGKNPQPIKYQN